MQPKSPAARGVFPALAAALLAGCKAEGPPPPPPHAGVRLRVSCPDQASADHVAAAARGWKTRQQADVEVVRYDPRSGPASAGADVWVLPAAELGRRADAGEVRTVPAEVLDDEAYAWGGLLPLYRERLLVWDWDRDGRRLAYALPVLGEGPVLVWRTDLMSEPPA